MIKFILTSPFVITTSIVASYFGAFWCTRKRGTTDIVSGKISAILGRLLAGGMILSLDFETFLHLYPHCIFTCTRFRYPSIYQFVRHRIFTIFVIYMPLTFINFFTFLRTRKKREFVSYFCENYIYIKL